MGFSLWDPRKNADDDYIDDVMLEMFERAATTVFVYKYLGVSETNDPTEIQDPVFGENRNRRYDPHVYEIHVVHNMQDLEYELMQFGQWVSSDTIYMEIHMRDSIRRIGRKLMPGDVFEVPHLRDDALLEEDAPAINKYYVVEEVTRNANGYGPTWFPHLYRVKLRPLTNSSEYDDILNLPILDGNGDPIGNEDDGPSIADIISDYNKQIEINDAIVAEAEAAVDRRNFETQQFYVVPGDELGSQYPWIFAGDGNPPNGAVLAGSGRSFPTTGTQEGDYFLRTDYDPKVLFRREGSTWRRIEVDWRKKWQAAHRILETFINNNNITTINGESFNEKTDIKKAVTIRADF